MMNIVRVVFFASFKERLNCGSLSVTLEDNATIPGLCGELASKDGVWKEIFHKPSQAVKVAHNQQIASLETVLADGDEVAFFPPVTGG